MSISVPSQKKHRLRKDSRAAAEVTSIRRAVYAIDESADVCSGSGEERVLGRIEPDVVLHDLFALRTFRWDWSRRVGGLRDLEEMKRGVEEGWLKEGWEQGMPDGFWSLKDPQACERARDRYEGALHAFLNHYGPLVDSDRMNDFRRAMEDLVQWALVSTGKALPFSPDTEHGKEFLQERAEMKARVDAALKTITYLPGGRKKCPTLYAALAWAIDLNVLCGINYYECKNPECRATFVPLRSDADYCDDRCRRRAWRKRKRA